VNLPTAVVAAPAAASGRGPAAPAVVRPNAVYAITSDGMLQTMYVSNSADVEAPVQFVPPRANATGLIVVDNVAYAETSASCNGVPNGVWALDLTSKQVVSWNSDSVSPAAFGPDGTVYVAAGKTLAALDPKSLKLKNSFVGKAEFSSSPVVFSFGDRVLVAASARDGSIRLVDGATMAAMDATPSASVANGRLATWQDSEGVRWIIAMENSGVSAWKVADRNGSPGLQLGWGWVNAVTTLTPIIVNGVVFVLSSGDSPVLNALDAASGSQLCDNGKSIAAPVHGGELSAGGGQVYLETSDGTLYAFGFPMEH
jgi:hypothetical protein